MSEIGQAVNKDRPEPVDSARIERLSAILDELLAATAC